jgi:type I restriction enzyme S subunit
MAEMMKDSGCRWIGEIPQNWNTKRIKYIATLKGRIGWQGLTSDEYQDEGAYLITGTDFIDGGINWDTCVHVPMKRWEEAKEIQIQEGDLLITKDGTVGKVAIASGVPGETSLNSGVLRIMPIEGYSRRFLFWVLQSDVFWNWFNYKNSGNSTILHLYQGDFAEFMYAFPNIEEQELIADFLDEHCKQIDDVISDLEKQIEGLKRYKKSLITETMTQGIDKTAKYKSTGNPYISSVPVHWELTRVKYLLDGLKDGTHGTFDRVDEGEMLLSAKNVFDDGLHISDNESLISFKDYKSIVANGYPRKGDVLLSCVGTIGRTCVYEYEQPYAFQRSTIFMRPKANVNSYFLSYALQANASLVQEKLLVNKSAQDGLYMGAAQNIIIPFTSDCHEQNAIVEYLNNRLNIVDKQIDERTKNLDIIIRLKSSTIFEYVTGKKRVKEVQ